MGRALPTAARRLLLLGPPLAFAVLAAFHPRPDVNPQSIMDVATWFTVFHLLQLPLIGLVALSVLLLADDFERASRWTIRIGLATFMVFFSAYDAVAGIATGYAMRNARDLTSVQQDGVFAVVEEWPGFDPLVFSINVVGTLGWVVALGAVAVAARRAGAPRSQWIFIALAGVFLMGGHPAPFGSLAFGSLFLAALLRERQKSRPAPATAG